MVHILHSHVHPDNATCDKKFRASNDYDWAKSIYDATGSGSVATIYYKLHLNPGNGGPSCEKPNYGFKTQIGDEGIVKTIRGIEGCFRYPEGGDMVSGDIAAIWPYFTSELFEEQRKFRGHPKEFMNRALSEGAVCIFCHPIGFNGFNEPLIYDTLDYLVKKGHIVEKSVLLEKALFNYPPLSQIIWGSPNVVVDQIVDGVRSKHEGCELQTIGSLDRWVANPKLLRAFHNRLEYGGEIFDQASFLNALMEGDIEIALDEGYLTNTRLNWISLLTHLEMLVDCGINGKDGWKRGLRLTKKGLNKVREKVMS